MAQVPSDHPDILRNSSKFPDFSVQYSTQTIKITDHNVNNNSNKVMS